MPEILEGQTNNHEMPAIDPESVEVLRAKLSQAENRERAKALESLSEDGVTADAAKLFEKVRAVHKHDSEADTHNEAGIPMPLKAKDNNQAIETLNRMIDTGNDDPDSMVKFLEQNVN